MSNTKLNSEQRRKFSTRNPIVKATEKNGRARLSVYRSEKHIYAQVINDVTGHTVAAASTIDKELKASLVKTSNKDAAVAVGKLVAERAKKAGVVEVAFDRGSYRYHGRVAALADAARDAGLSF